VAGFYSAVDKIHHSAEIFCKNFAKIPFDSRCFHMQIAKCKNMQKLNTAKNAGIGRGQRKAFRLFMPSKNNELC
jgi:hypothetical protein